MKSLFTLLFTPDLTYPVEVGDIYHAQHEDWVVLKVNGEKDSSFRGKHTLVDVRNSIGTVVHDYIIWKENFSRLKKP